MTQIFNIINGIDDMNDNLFIYFVIIMALEILIANYIFKMLEHKVKNIHVVEDLQSGILNNHN